MASTVYQAGRHAAEVRSKRYRYTGKERDEENGFTYHGARYYAPWLGRWVSADPLVAAINRSSKVLEDVVTSLSAHSSLATDLINLYIYVRNNPLRLTDPTGLSSSSGPNYSQRVRPRIGSEAHKDILPKLAKRLQDLGYDAVSDTSASGRDLSIQGSLTHPGGSLTGKSRGEIDLLIRQLRHNIVVGQIYELKPTLSLLSSKTQSQVSRYVKMGQKLMKPGRPLAYVKGTLLGELDENTREHVLAPIIVDKGEFIRTYVLWLPQNNDSSYKPGLIGYSYYDIKKPKPEKQEEKNAQQVDSKKNLVALTPGPEEIDSDS